MFQLTDSQKAKIVAVLTPLFSDTEFDNVDNLNVLATEKVAPAVPPVPGTDNVDVKPTPAS